MEIQYWPFERIDQTVFSLIVDNGLFEPHYAADNTGFAGAAQYYREEEFSIFSHIWIAHLDGQCVGVCAIKHTSDPCVNVFVRPEYRNKGIGTKLLECAMATGEEFGAVYTESSKHLYTRFGLPDILADS